MYPEHRFIRKRGVDSLIEELALAKTVLPFIKRVSFDDDSFFMYSKEEIKEFCAGYKKEIGLDLTVTGATPATLTREKLAPLVDAGLSIIRMGIQTGSKRTKKMYKRRYSNDQIEKAARVINEFKDRLKLPAYDVILDNPWEKDADLIETLFLLSRIPPPYYLSLFSLTFYPETELYEKAKKCGLIKNDLDDVYRKYFHDCRKIYLNKLFFLLQKYASSGKKIPAGMMRFLVSPASRQSGMGFLLYLVLAAWIVPFGIAKKIEYLISELTKDLRRMEFGRIKRYLKNLKRKV